MTPNTSSSLTNTRGKLYSSGSETETLDIEEKSKMQIQDWDKVNMMDLLDEYDRLHRKKQKGSAEEVKEMRKVINKRIEILGDCVHNAESEVKQLKNEALKANETINELKAELGKKEKENTTLNNQLQTLRELGIKQEPAQIT